MTGYPVLAVFVSALLWASMPCSAQEIEPDCDPDSPYGCPGGGGGSGSTGGGVDIPEPLKPEPFNPRKEFVASVCLQTAKGDYACFKENGQQALNRLLRAAGKKFIHSLVAEEIRLLFPTFRPSTEALRVLIGLELEMVKQLQAQMREDLKKIQPMSWETPEEIARKRKLIETDTRVINVWADAARKSAMENSNWQSWGPYQVFVGGEAYRQLNRTLVGKEWFR